MKDAKEIVSAISDDFKVAYEIYHHQLRGKSLGYKQLIKEMTAFMGEDGVRKALDMLLDWGIIKVQFNDRDHKIFTIDQLSEPTIVSMYDKYWRKYKILTQNNPLSNPFKVACEIYSYNKKGEDIWGDKLIHEMQGILSKGTINRSLELLYDWSIVKCTGIVGDKGKSRKLLTISPQAKYMVEQNYDHCWEEYRQLIAEYNVPDHHEFYDDLDDSDDTFEE